MHSRECRQFDGMSSSTVSMYAGLLLGVSPPEELAFFEDWSATVQTVHASHQLLEALA